MTRGIPGIAALSGLGLAVCCGTAWADIGCRAIGIEARQGESLCIRTPAGLRLAECGMNLNVSNWTFLGTCTEPSTRDSEQSLPTPSDTEEK